MTKTSKSPISEAPFKEGNRCLLVIMDQRYLVAVLHVSLETLRVSFPICDYPVEGMRVALEFHDEKGFTRYETDVLETSKIPGDGLLLRMPQDVSREEHRNFWRVPAGFKGLLKGHVHPRRHEVEIIDISAGGVRVQCTEPLEAGETVEITFALPSEFEETLTAEVVYLPEGNGSEENARCYGLGFIAPDPVVMRAISNFIWRSVRKLHKNEIISRVAPAPTE